MLSPSQKTSLWLRLLPFLRQARLWTQRLRVFLRRESSFAATGPDGLKILLQGERGELASTLEIWFKDQNLSLIPLRRGEKKRWQPDLVLSSVQSFGRRKPAEESQRAASERTLFTQPYVEMEVPLRPDFEQFLYEVLPKKRRTYIRKAQKFPYQSELSRDPELLAFFLREILNPATEDRHGEKSQHLEAEAVMAKGELWQLLLLRNQEGEIVGGNLLLRSRWQRQLRIWRQAVHPQFAESAEKHNILLVLNTAPLELGCREGLNSVSFGISPHLLDDSNFYSKRLWACRPSWNESQALISIKVLSDKGRNFIEQRPLLCESPFAGSPDAVLVPRAWTHPESRELLKEWLNKYGFQDLNHVAVLHEDRLQFEKISSLEPAGSAGSANPSEVAQA